MAQDNEAIEFEGEAFKLAARCDGGELQLSFGEIYDEPEEIPELDAQEAERAQSQGGGESAGSTGVKGEYTICVDKPIGGITGLELDPLDKKTMQVCNVRAGVIRSYNTTAPPELQVKEGDIIVAVNGVRGDASQMITRFKEDMTIELALFRPRPWRISIKQKPGDLLSSLKCAASGISLLLVDVPRTIKDFNACNARSALREDDRIIAVNGINNDVRKMLLEVDRASNLDLVLIRSVPRSKAGEWGGE